MAAKRSPKELAELAAFVRRLYQLGGFATWREFAEAAKISAPQVSEYQRGTAEPSGLSLLRLVQAAAARAETDAAETALRESLRVAAGGLTARLESVEATATANMQSLAAAQVVAGQQKEEIRELQERLEALERIRIVSGPARQSAARTKRLGQTRP